MTDVKLEPCPFCGGEATRHTIGNEEPNNAGGDVIACTRCGASSAVEFGRKENLVSRWNTRHQPQEREAVLEEAVKPWADFHGDLPDYDHPLRPVFESGIQYSVELLAKELGVEDYEICDGTEEFDGDLGGTMLNIVRKTWPTDEHGDWIDPRAALTTPAPPSEREAVLEEAAKACEEQQRIFASSEYAAGQPMSSFGERFAAGRCAEAIRALKTTPAPAEDDDALIRRIEYILDPAASAKERAARRAHLTNHDLRTILSRLRGEGE